MSTSASDRTIFRVLVEDGPGTWADLFPDTGYGQFSIPLRQHGGARRVLLSFSSSGATMSRSPQRAVLYSAEHHDPRDVVRAYIEANPDLVDGNRPGAVTQAFGDHSAELADAWRDVRDEYEDRLNVLTHDGGQKAEASCSFCDWTGTYLPSHLPDCPNKP